MKRNFLQFLAIFGFTSMLLASCIKEEDHLKEMPAGTGSTFVKFAEGPELAHFFSKFSDVKKTELFSVAKAANSAEALKSATTITLKSRPDLIEEYNDEHNLEFELLPDSIYTLTNSAFTKTADGYTVNLVPGEFASGFSILLDGSKWDVSHAYALAFTIQDQEGVNVSNGKRDILVLISVKNQWDGIYSVQDGEVTRYTNPTTVESPSTLNGTLAGNPDVTLATISPNTVEISGLQWTAGSGSGVAGIDNLRATINPETNEVTMFSLGNATLTNWEGKENRYDPETKTFYLAFRWNPTAATREYQIELKYKGPR